MDDENVAHDISRIPRAYGWLQRKPIEPWKIISQPVEAQRTVVETMTDLNESYIQDNQFTLDGARFMEYREEDQFLRIRLDHSTCLEFWMQITIPNAFFTRNSKLVSLEAKGRLPYRAPGVIGNTFHATLTATTNRGDDWDYVILINEIPHGRIVFSHAEMMAWISSEQAENSNIQRSEDSAREPPL